jgi:thioesterase domain-containing protein
MERDQPASAMAAILMDAQPEGGFLMLGYSSGGNLAYDTALELESHGRRVEGLVLLDTWRRLEPFHFTDEEYSRAADEFLSALGSSDPALKSRVEAYDRYVDSRNESREVAFPIRLVQSESQDVQCPFRITQEGWGELADDFAIAAGSGPHLQMLDEPHAARNAAIVQGILEELAGLDDK